MQRVVEAVSLSQAFGEGGGRGWLVHERDSLSDGLNRLLCGLFVLFSLQGQELVPVMNPRGR